MIRSIDNRVAERIKTDPEFRREWFRAELEQSIPELYRNLREDRQFTQAELAEKVDMKQSAISRFEQSSAPTWKMETLLRLAEAMDARLKVELEKYEDAIASIEQSENQSASKKPKSFELSYQLTNTSLADTKDPSHGALIDQPEYGNFTVLGGKRRTEGQYVQSYRNAGGEISIQGMADSAGTASRQASISARYFQQSLY